MLLSCKSNTQTSCDCPPGAPAGSSGIGSTRGEAAAAASGRSFMALHISLGGALSTSTPHRGVGGQVRAWVTGMVEPKALCVRGEGMGMYCRCMCVFLHGSFCEKIFILASICFWHLAS